MINLLPAEHKRQIKAARTNVLLLRYAILSLVSVTLLGLIAGGTYFAMDNVKRNAQNTIADNQAKSSSYSDVEKQATEFRSNLTTAKAILDKQVNYTSVVLAIAQSLPPNIILESLDLDATTFGTPFSLAAKARSYEDALILKDTLQQSDVFSNVYLESISNEGGDGGGDNTGGNETGYPVSVNLNVTINKEVAQ